MVENMHGCTEAYQAHIHMDKSVLLGGNSCVSKMRKEGQLHSPVVTMLQEDGGSLPYPTVTRVLELVRHI